MNLSTTLRRWWPLLLLAAAVFGAVGVLLASAGESDDVLVVYNGRSHYGGERAFEDFTRETGIEVKLFGGDAESLHQRLKSEGARTPADVLVTVDGANLWRADAEGLLVPMRSKIVDDTVPASLRDPDGAWTALSTRVRTPMISTERAQPDDVRSYDDLGDPRWKGKLCLRTSNNVYNQSLVADLIAKRGEVATEKLLRSWMANGPRILGSDVDVLKAIAAGQCDVGLTNNYYLARELRANPELPVAPAWPEQDGDGAHANISGAGVVKGTDRAAEAVQLIEFLVQRQAQQAIAETGEFPVNPEVPPAARLRAWDDVRKDPIDVAGAGGHAQDAVALMAAVGWR